jgi:four helix bundle protein
MGVKHHRDLVVWQRGMDLVAECHPPALRLQAQKAFWLQDQLLRAASSIPANIAEGHGRYSTGSYRNHLSIATGSLREVETHLETAVRLKLLAPEEIRGALETADHVGRLLWGLRNAIRDWKGPISGRLPTPRRT